MRAQDFTDTTSLFEIDMSPSNLERLASGITANVGMEFEMVMPDILEPYEEPEQEADYDMDERANSIDDIIGFFNNSDYNSRAEILDLKERLQSKYDEWFEEHALEQWEENRGTIIEEYIDGEEFDTPEEREERIEELEDGSTRESRRLRDRFIDDYRGENYGENERDWLKEAGLDHMSDIENRYNITWPYWTTSEDEDRSEWSDEIADDIAELLAPYVKPFGVTRYSKLKDYATQYAIAQDGSIDVGKDPSAVQLEIVSPYMPLDQMTKQFVNIRQFAKTYNCTTNESTGLHINVSLPNRSRSSLDYMKLVLLLGDRWVLDAYDRLNSKKGQHYAASAFDKIREYALETKPDATLEYLEKISKNFSTLMSQKFQRDLDINLNKYVSANLRATYDFVFIEFRSPGGDWLNEDLGKIAATVRRFVVALDAACDPNKYKSEYLKKLYQLLSQALPEQQDSIKYFIQFKNEPDVLKQKLRQLQLGRTVPAGELESIWQVTMPGMGSVQVRARYKNEAIRLAIEQNPELQGYRGFLEVERISAEQPSDEGQKYEWDVRSRVSPAQATIIASTRAGAISQYLDAYPWVGSNELSAITATPIRRV